MTQNGDLHDGLIKLSLKSVVTVGQTKYLSNSLAAQKTRLGWVLSGCVPDVDNEPAHTEPSVHSVLFCREVKPTVTASKRFHDLKTQQATKPVKVAHGPVKLMTETRKGTESVQLNDKEAKRSVLSKKSVLSHSLLCSEENKRIMRSLHSPSLPTSVSHSSTCAFSKKSKQILHFDTGQSEDDDANSEL